MRRLIALVPLLALAACASAGEGPERLRLESLRYSPGMLAGGTRVQCQAISWIGSTARTFHFIVPARRELVLHLRDADPALVFGEREVRVGRHTIALAEHVGALLLDGREVALRPNVPALFLDGVAAGDVDEASARALEATRWWPYVPEAYLVRDPARGGPPLRFEFKSSRRICGTAREAIRCLVPPRPKEGRVD